MKRFREFLEIILLILFIGFILLLAHFTISGARKISHTVDDVDRTIQIVAGAASNVEKGARAWEKSSTAQAKSSTEAFERLSASAKSLNSLLISTDASLNSLLLPSLSTAITEQNAALLKTQGDLQADLASIAPVTAETLQTLADADKVVSDPAIKASLDNLATATGNASVATSEASATMKDVRTAADYELKQLMAPVSKVKAALEIAARVVGRFLGF